MNAFFRNASFASLLVLSSFLLPACGSKANVQSEKAPETVLSAEATPTVSTEPMAAKTSNEGPNVERSYTAKLHRAKGPNSTTVVSTTPVDTPANTPVATQNTPPMETPAPAKKSGGSHWFLWLVVLAVLGGIGYYFWAKNQEEMASQSNQPKPPTGGLSPVSGFTAVRSDIEEGADRKPSFWTRELF